MPTGLHTQSQRSGEVMTGGGQRGHAHQGCLVVPWLQGERTTQHALGLRVVAGISGDPCLLHVRQAQRCERIRVIRCIGEVLLQAGDRALESAASAHRRRPAVVGLHGSRPSCIVGRHGGLRPRAPKCADAARRRTGRSASRADHRDPCDPSHRVISSFRRCVGCRRVPGPAALCAAGPAHP